MTNIQKTEKKIWKYVYTLLVDYDNLSARIRRPAKSRIWVKFVLNWRYRTKEFMEKQIVDCIERLESWEKVYSDRILERKNNRSAHITPAQAVKKELTKAFPNVKFSCTYQTYSMWSSVDIWWVDWPTEKEVNIIAKKYQYGSFDWMTDMYEYTNSRDDIPQAKYVFCRREMSDTTRENIKKWVDALWDITFYNDWRDLVYCIFNKYSIPVWSTVLWVKKNGVTAWVNSIEEFYCLDMAQ